MNVNEVIECNYLNETFYFSLDNPKGISKNKNDVLKFSSMEPQAIHDTSEAYDYYCLFLTDKCNMQCTYCFENFQNNPKLQETIVKPEEFILFLKSRNKKELSIRFFGGEPLLKKDLFLSYLSALCRYAKECNIVINYNIFTNGILLDNEILKILKKENFMIFLSFDGSKKMHNMNRIYSAGDSYDEAIHAIDLIKKNNMLDNLVIRTVYDIDSGVSLWDCVKSSLQLGVKVVSFEIPWAPNSSNYVLNESREQRYIYEIQNLTRNYVKCIQERQFSCIGIHPISSYLMGWFQDIPIMQVSACSAGNNFYAIDSLGDIYPCHVLIGNKQFKMGNIYSGFKQNNFSTNFENYASCTSCHLKFMCKSRCPADNFLKNGNIYENNKYRCILQKEIFKASIFLFYYILNDPYAKKTFKFLFDKSKAKNFKKRNKF